MANPKEVAGQKEQPARKPRRQRSPNYPGIDLEDALKKAQKLWTEERRNEVAPVTLMEHWGYRKGSSPGLVALGALRAFGLIEAAKPSGKLKLTELAVRIILDTREDQSEKLKAIQEAALHPATHRLMWEKFGCDLPSDSSLKYFLVTEMRFTESGAAQFIGEYRATFQFASLGDRGTLSGGEGEETSEEPPMMVPQATPQTPAEPMGLPSTPKTVLREVKIPIPGASWASITAPFPLSEEAWSMMLDILKAMKPGLVQAKPEED